MLRMCGTSSLYDNISESKVLYKLEMLGNCIWKRKIGSHFILPKKKNMEEKLIMA